MRKRHRVWSYRRSRLARFHAVARSAAVIVASTTFNNNTKAPEANTDSSKLYITLMVAFGSKYIAERFITLPLVMVERHSWNSVFPIPRSVDMGLQEII